MESFGLSVNPTQISPWVYALTAYSLGTSAGLPLLVGGKPTAQGLAYATYWGVSRGVLLHTRGISWTTAGYWILLNIIDDTVAAALK